MKRIKSISSLITVISLFLGVIWLGQAMAAGVPTFAALGNLQADGMAIPRAMDLDGNGNLFVADVDSGKVFKFDRFGTLAGSFDLGANGLGVAVTADGSKLFVSKRDGGVAIVDAVTGEQLGALEGSFGTAGEIDLDAAGEYVYVADNLNRVIKVYHVSGGSVAEFGGAGTVAGTFSTIGGMAVAPNGQVVVADISNSKVHVFTLDGSFAVVDATAYENSDAAVFGVELSSPRGVAFDDQGRAFFLEFINSRIHVVDVSGAYSNLGQYDKPGLRVGQLYAVADAVYDAGTQRLFVSCDGGRVEVLGVDGGSTPQDVNHAPTVPTPQSPVAGSGTSTVNPVLVVNNATDEDGDALTYQVVVSQNESVVYQVDVPAEAGETTSVVVSADLVENAAYSWTAEASDGELTSGASAAANFVVNAVEEAPSVPELVAPLDGETMGGRDAFIWGVSTDPDPTNNNVSYRIDVALDQGFVDIVETVSLEDNALVLDTLAAYGELVNGAAYFWRVSAVDAGQTESAPSEVRQFVYETTGLTITANMPDAKVSFHGNHAYAGQGIGVAPVELRDLAPGTFSVVVERDGFEPFVSQVNLAEGEKVDLYAELSPAMSVDKLSASRNGINGRSGLAVNGPAAPFLVDFDNDGDLDMLVGDGAGGLTLFANMQIDGRNRLNFDVGSSQDLPTVSGAAVPFVADWNNDGRKDLLVGQANGGVTLYINNGLEVAPAFAAGEDLYAGSSVLSVGSNAAPAVINYNDDSAKDLLVANADGKVFVFMNLGSDAVPQLAAAPVELSVSGSVAFPVDWNADGEEDLMITDNGRVTVYLKAGDAYQAGPQFSDRRADYVAAFPIDLDGSGNQLLVGQANGELVYLTGNSTEPVASFQAALQDKVAELAERVAADAPAYNDDVNAIDALIAAGDYVAAADAISTLIAVLPAGEAQQSAMELLALL